jgi:hypothetical protein
VKIWLLLTLKITKMKVRFLPFLMLPMLGMAQGNSNGEKPTGELLSNEISPNEMKRNASFNLDEIKVRWKKAALENCPGVPCVSITPPGPVSNIVATVTSPTSVRVTFGEPASNGGSPITGYEATATPTSSAPAKRKSSATITIKGDKSPIDIPGLTTGQNYIFTVVALNAAGGSTPTVTVTPVTPCKPNTATTLETEQCKDCLTEFIINTTGATGIGNDIGLPPGLKATWSEDKIKIFGKPELKGTFSFSIYLKGGCGSEFARGSILVIEQCPRTSAGQPSSNPTIIVNTFLNTPITFNPLNATDIEVISDGGPFDSGLPPGMTASWANNIITISGKPTQVGTFDYRIRVLGNCNNEIAEGVILVTEN